MHLFLVGFYFIISLFSGCSDVNNPIKTDSNKSNAIYRDDLLVQSYLDHIVAPTFDQILSSLRAMKEETLGACHLGHELDLGSQRQRWLKSMYDFHYLSALVYGPQTLLNLNGPLRFIYSHPPSIAQRMIEREIGKASQQLSNYQQPRPLAHSLGFQALEYVLFAKLRIGIQQLEPGVCSYKIYVLNDLANRIQEYREDWQREKVSHIFSPQGQTKLSTTVNLIAGHMALFTSQILLEESLRKPLALTLASDCMDAQQCLDLYLDHPHSTDRKLRLTAGLSAIHDIFMGRQVGDSRTFSFKDYFAENPELHQEFQSIGQLKQLWQQLPPLELMGVKAQQDLPQDLKVFLDLFTQFSFWLSTDFIVELNAELPKPVQGDGD
jgi:predicted lipoprotein